MIIVKPLSTKLKGIPRSNIRKLFDLLSSKQDAISLGIGQPDFGAPREVIDGTIAALEAGKGSVYAPTMGVPRLRELVAQKLERENNIVADPNANVLIAPGGSGTISLAFSALFNPGDELLMFSPNFVSYFHVARIFDATVVEAPRRADFGPDVDAIASLITPHTKAILINSPNNPTGYTYSKDELEAVSSLCVDNDLYLISDEVYEKYLYDGRQHVSPASLDGMADRTITINAFSKTFSVTGMRVGFLSANESITALMENFLQFTSAGTNHPCQYGAISGLEYLLENPSFLDEHVATYAARRDTCHARLNEMGLTCPKPGGAFYIMPDVSATGMNGDEFSSKLVDGHGVAVVPGSTFGQYSGNLVRISYALREDLLDEALNRIETFLGH